MKGAVMTDSNAGIKPDEAAKLAAKTLEQLLPDKDFQDDLQIFLGDSLSGGNFV